MTRNARLSQVAESSHRPPTTVFPVVTFASPPDHDSINAFRKWFIKELKGLFVDILVWAKNMGTLKLGRINQDGIKVKTSKHKAQIRPSSRSCNVWSIAIF
jgi:hypothetical protein